MEGAGHGLEEGTDQTCLEEEGLGEELPIPSAWEHHRLALHPEEGFRKCPLQCPVLVRQGSKVGHQKHCVDG